MDFDHIVKGNTATQLLTTDHDIHRPKARTVAAALETLGLRTRVVERAFDSHFHPVSHGNRDRNEPIVALAGFDDVVPRRKLGDAGFARTVDAGIGSGPVEYLDTVDIPCGHKPCRRVPGTTLGWLALSEKLQAEIAEQVEAGVDPSAARCGMLDIAGITVGAAFEVGTFASTLVVADVLRALHDGASYSVIAVDLQSPGGILPVEQLPGDLSLVNTRVCERRPRSVPGAGPVDPCKADHLFSTIANDIPVLFVRYEGDHFNVVASVVVADRWDKTPWLGRTTHSHVELDSCLSLWCTIEVAAKKYR